MTVAEQLALNFNAGTVLNAFAGPAGWEEGAQIIGINTDEILGVEINEQACTAAVTAGHSRHRGDIRDVDPADYPHVIGFLCSSPCPTFSKSGIRSGLGDDYQVLLDVITHAGAAYCRCTWQEIETELGVCTDPRTALAAQTIRFALGLPNLEWLAFEQVPGAEFMFEDIAAELLSYDDETDEGPGWVSADVITVEATDLGMPVRRTRTFLVARRSTPLGGRGVADPALARHLDFTPHTFAEVLGWEPGHSVRTRANRRPTGGNLFPADGLGWCLTEKARTWERDADGRRLTAAEAGLLQGFRADYPWHGSRTRQFHQLADVVLPPVAAAVLGYVTGTQWTAPVRDYLDMLYGGAAARKETA